MDRILSARELKNEFDRFYKLDISVYERLRPYLIKKSYPKGQVLKQSHSIESHARYVYRGVLAKTYPAEKGLDYKVMIYTRGKVGADLDSYFKGTVSPYGIKALVYTSVLELSPEAENSILDSIPEIHSLSTAINRAILANGTEWGSLLMLPLEEGLTRMQSQFKKELGFLSMKDLGYLFNCSDSKINRTCKKLNIKR